MATPGDDGKSQMSSDDDIRDTEAKEDVPTSTLVSTSASTEPATSLELSAATAATAEDAVEAEPLAAVNSGSSPPPNLTKDTLNAPDTSTSNTSAPGSSLSPVTGDSQASNGSDDSAHQQQISSIPSETVKHEVVPDRTEPVASEVHDIDAELVKSDHKAKSATSANTEPAHDSVDDLTASLDQTKISHNDQDPVASTSAALKEDQPASTQLVGLSLPSGPDAKDNQESDPSSEKPDQTVTAKDISASGSVAISDESLPPLPKKETALPVAPQTGKEAEAGPTAGVPHASINLPSSQEHRDVSTAFAVDERTSASSSAQPIIEKPVPATPDKGASVRAHSTPSSGLKIGKGPPPTTNPQEEKPFDFNIFLDQMKDPSARGVGEYVRSFIKGFAKKPYRTQDQIKLIFDFLDFISVKMRQCSIWANASETDFENAKEAMEKLVMNRLYGFTFTPAVAKEGKWTPQTDDLERDRVLKERIELFDWVTEEHLDVPTGEHSKGFVDFAIQGEPIRNGRQTRKLL